MSRTSSISALKGDADQDTTPPMITFTNMKRITEGSDGSEEEISASSSGRIMNGGRAGDGSFPWMVALYNRSNPRGFLPVCGGSMITPSVVLTAAHCIFSIQSAEVGRYNYEADEEGVETFVEIERRFHPDFDLATFNFDYALIKLERPHPNPFLVNLRRTREVPSKLQIMGWGYLEKDGEEQSTRLQSAVVKRVPYEDCIDTYGREAITENMFCAKDEDIDSYKGDSGGGPIIIADSNVQVGIASWGQDYANPLFPVSSCRYRLRCS